MADLRRIIPPANVNEAILSAIIRHATFVERLKTGEANQVVRFLDDNVLPDILSTIEKELRRLPRRPSSRERRLGVLTRDLRDVIRSGFGDVRAESKSRIQAFGVNEVDWLAKTIRQVMPIEFEMVIPPGQVVRAAIGTTGPTKDILGHSWNDWWNNLSQRTTSTTMQQVRIGISAGESVPRMVRRIRGTRRSGFKDGTWATTRREAAAVVRTTMNHVSSQARSELTKANDDLIKEEKWLSTLDSRTTVICAALDGRVFKPGEGLRPPAHVQCRSVVVPVLKSFREMGIDLDDPPPPTRAARQYKDLKTALSGKVPSDVTYGKWLRNQPVGVQNAVLGPGKAKIFRAGRVKIERFTNSQNRPLTLQELKKLDSEFLTG